MKIAITLSTFGTVVCCVAAYVGEVSQRNSGRGTHIGGDVIILVYVVSALLVLLTTILAKICHNDRKERSWVFVIPAMAFITLLTWLYLHQSGRVSEYKKEMRNEPNKAMEPTPVNVTIPADAGLAPFTSMAHLGR